MDVYGAILYVCPMGIRDIAMEPGDISMVLCGTTGAPDSNPDCGSPLSDPQQPEPEFRSGKLVSCMYSEPGSMLPMSPPQPQSLPKSLPQPSQQPESIMAYGCIGIAGAAMTYCVCGTIMAR